MNDKIPDNQQLGVGRSFTDVPQKRVFTTRYVECKTFISKTYPTLVILPLTTIDKENTSQQNEASNDRLLSNFFSIESPAEHKRYNGINISGGGYLFGGNFCQEVVKTRKGNN